MIRLLIALHPRRWRREYGPEYRALLEDTPLTAQVVLDVLRNAARLQAAAHAGLLRVLVALALSSIGEVVAAHGNYAENVLWLPASPAKALLLAAVLLPWIPVVTRRRRRLGATRHERPAGDREESHD
jgi:hypothetical protein